jgi:hypothetical protein
MSARCKTQQELDDINGESARQLMSKWPIPRRARHRSDSQPQDSRLRCIGCQDGVIWELLELARFLVEYGADVTTQDKVGSTPPHRVS